MAVFLKNFANKIILFLKYFIFMLAYVIFILEIFTAQVSLFFFCPFPLYYLLRSCKIISFSQPKTKRERVCVIVVGDQNFL